MLTDTLRQVRLQLNFSKNNGLLLAQLAFDTAILAGILYALQRGTTGGKVCAVLLSPVLFFNAFSLMHDAVHKSLSNQSWVNDLVGTVAGTFCFLPFEPWRQMHLEHHVWAGNIEKDPVNKIRKDYDPNKVRKNRILSTIWQSWLPILALLQHVVFWLYPLQYFKKRAQHRGRGLVFVGSFAIPAAIYLAILGHGISLTPLLPGVFIYFMMVEFVNLPHHLDLPAFRGDTRLGVLEQYRIARSGIYPRWFSRWVLLNFNLHLEHHLFPNLPWHELERARAIVRPILGDKYNETFGFKWLFAHRNQPLDKLLVGGIESAEPTRLSG